MLAKGVWLPVFFLFSCSGSGPVEVVEKGDSTESIDSSAVQSEIKMAAEWKNFKDSILKFPFAKFDKVLACTYLVDYEDSSMGFLPGKEIKISNTRSVKTWKKDAKPIVELSEMQIAELMKIIRDSASYWRGAIGCFYPRNGFFFYNAKDSLVGSFDICFQCNNSAMMPEFAGGSQTPIDSAVLVDLRGFIKSLGLKVLDTNEDPASQ